jgi:low affinity Fe/Cu permease
MKRDQPANRSVSHAWFPTFARHLASWSGRSSAFFAALGLVIAWLVTGPLFGYSDTWQLVINTSTTIVTFLMVFLIQHTQNRDTEAIQIKLDELIRATRGAHNSILDLEQLDEEELVAQHDLYARLARNAREKLRQGMNDVDCPTVPVARAIGSPNASSGKRRK